MGVIGLTHTHSVVQLHGKRRQRWKAKKKYFLCKAYKVCLEIALYLHKRLVCVGPSPLTSLMQIWRKSTQAVGDIIHDFFSILNQTKFLTECLTGFPLKVKKYIWDVIEIKKVFPAILGFTNQQLQTKSTALSSRKFIFSRSSFSEKKLMGKNLLDEKFPPSSIDLIYIFHN